MNHWAKFDLSLRPLRLKNSIQVKFNFQCDFFFFISEVSVSFLKVFTLISRILFVLRPSQNGQNRFAYWTFAMMEKWLTFDCLNNL